MKLKLRPLFALIDILWLPYETLAYLIARDSSIVSLINRPMSIRLVKAHFYLKFSRTTLAFLLFIFPWQSLATCFLSHYTTKAIHPTLLWFNEQKVKVA